MEFRVVVESLSEKLDMIELQGKISQKIPELQRQISKKTPIKVAVRREEGFPIEPQLLHLIFSIDWGSVAHSIEGPIAAAAVAETVAWLKRRFNVSATNPTT